MTEKQSVLFQTTTLHETPTSAEKSCLNSENKLKQIKTDWTAMNSSNRFVFYNLFISSTMPSRFSSSSLAFKSFWALSSFQSSFSVFSSFLFATSSARILSCSLSDKAYFNVGNAERTIPIAGGIEIRKNIAAAYLPTPEPPSYVMKLAPSS